MHRRSAAQVTTLRRASTDGFDGRAGLIKNASPPLKRVENELSRKNTDLSTQDLSFTRKHTEELKRPPAGRGLGLLATHQLQAPTGTHWLSPCTRLLPCTLTLSLSPCLYTVPSMTVPVYTRTQTLIITLHYTCCYDEIKRTQDFKICLSHADSLHDSLCRCLTLSMSACLSVLLSGCKGRRSWISAAQLTRRSDWSDNSDNDENSEQLRRACVACA